MADDSYRQKYRHLCKQFSLLTFIFEDGLREKLMDACGDRDAFGFTLGRVLYWHACGVWGPVSAVDRKLNDHILGTWRDGHQRGRWVVSRHRVARMSLEIMTDVATGETRLRRAHGPFADANAASETERSHA